MTLVEWVEYITPDGKVYNLHDGVTRFLMGGVSGLGMPGAEYLTEQGPEQDGETVVDYRLEPRLIQLIHRRIGKSRLDYWDMRADVINYFRPNRQTKAGGVKPGVLRHVLPDGSQRDLDVFVDKTPDFVATPADQWDEYCWTVPIRMIVPNPAFRDPVTQSVVFVGSPPTSQLAFPIGFPIIFGQQGYLNASGSANYAGTWPAYPVIVITGPINNPRIENLATGEKIELTYNIPAGTQVTIDLTTDDKTVLDNNGNDLQGTVTTDSHLATFHLAHDPEAPGGVNYLAGYGTDALITSTIVIQWHTRYIGI